MDVFSWRKGPIAAKHVVTELGAKRGWKGKTQEKGWEEEDKGAKGEEGKGNREEHKM